MKPIDVLTSPWAILPDKLGEITEIYSTHLRGEKIDLASLEARLGQPLNREPQGYIVDNGVALIPVDGVIAKRMNLFTRISGGASTELIARDIRDAVADTGVNAIILLVDSPGGSVDGTQALAQVVREAADVKPIVTWADGMMASAAYWIGAAADRAYISGDTTFVGSIGVVSQHVDMSEYQKKLGVKTTEIYAGKFKRIASEYQPLSKDGKAYMQDMVDHLYSVFVADVAKFRGASEEQVIADMADGRIFIGANAIKAGLVDGVSTLEALIETLAAGSYEPRRAGKQAQQTQQTQQGAAGAATPVHPTEAAATPAPAGAAPAPVPVASIEPATNTKGQTKMDKTTFAKDHPELFAEIQNDAAASERARIQGVEAQSMPGHEALINTLKFDGKTTGPEAAVQILQAHKGKLAAKGQALADDAAAIPALAPSTDAAADAAAKAAADNALPIDDRCKKTWEADAGIRQEFGTLAAYTAYEKAMSGGKVRQLADRVQRAA